MKTVGVLAVQGSFIEHLNMLNRIAGVRGIPVKSRSGIESIDGLILPGGESTAQGKLLRNFNLLEPLRTKILQGLPVWGTCAGMILLAREIAGGEPAHLRVMDITVRRNAYGGQLDSFADTAVIPAISSVPVPLVFIRAPWIEKTGKNVRQLAALNGKTIAAQEGRMLATSFHPELTNDLTFHRYFCGLLK